MACWTRYYVGGGALVLLPFIARRDVIRPISAGAIIVSFRRTFAPCRQSVIRLADIPPPDITCIIGHNDVCDQPLGHLFTRQRLSALWTPASDNRICGQCPGLEIGDNFNDPFLHNKSFTISLQRRLFVCFSSWGGCY